MKNRKTFDEQYERAKKAGEQSNKSEPRAESACYDSRSKRIVVQLRDGKDFSFSPEWVPGLRGASPFDLANIEVSPSGAGLYWERLDEDLSLPALLQGVFGPADIAGAQSAGGELFESLCAQIEIGWSVRRDATLVDRLAAAHPEYSAELYEFFTLLFESEFDSADDAEDNGQSSEKTLVWLEKEGFAMVREIVKDRQDDTPNTTPVAPASSQLQISSTSGDEEIGQPDEKDNVLTFKSLARKRLGYEDEDIDKNIAPTPIVEFVQKQPAGTYQKTREAIVQFGKDNGIDENEGEQAINTQAYRAAARRRTNRKKPTLTEIVKKLSINAGQRKFWLNLAKEDEKL